MQPEHAARGHWEDAGLVTSLYGAALNGLSTGPRTILVFVESKTVLLLGLNESPFRCLIGPDECGFKAGFLDIVFKELPDFIDFSPQCLLVIQLEIGLVVEDQGGIAFAEEHFGYVNDLDLLPVR
jgi:hypothetical protein